ncbi:MAG: acylphosphatase [Actinomycetota bacterium]|nr:acylphosphatase [Actinomycetota bacterium]
MEETTGVEAIAAKVTGRVQGVGYRYTAAHTAERLGLLGWVRNASDGSVEVRAQGDAGVLEQFIVFLKQGPRAARVRSVDVHPVEPNPTLSGFTVRF